MRKKTQKAGSGYIPSAWDWMLKTVGSGNTQFNNTFRLTPGDNTTTDQSNDIVAVKNSTMKGGRRKHKHTYKKGKKGGNFISQAIVPLSLFGLLKAYPKKHSAKHHKRRHRHRNH
jgi:hypothetical protein